MVNKSLKQKANEAMKWHFFNRQELQNASINARNVTWAIWTMKILKHMCNYYNVDHIHNKGFKHMWGYCTFGHPHNEVYISNRNLGIAMPTIYTMRVLKHKCRRGWNKTYTSYSSYTWSKYLSKNIGEITSLVFWGFKVMRFRVI
jgi:hypothetical protein